MAVAEIRMLTRMRRPSAPLPPAVGFGVVCGDVVVESVVVETVVVLVVLVVVVVSSEAHVAE